MTRPAHRPWGATAAVALALFATPHAAAQNFTWNNPAGGSWNTAANWTPDSGTPGFPNALGARATFGSAATGTANVTLASDVTVGQIVFDNVGAAAVYAIGTSGRTISLTSANGVAGTQITVNSGALGLVNPQEFVAGQTLQVIDFGGLTITNNSPATTLLFSGPLVIGTFPLTVTGIGAVSFGADALRGTANLTKSGTGVLTFGGDDVNFTGRTTVTGGVVSISTPQGLGADPGSAVANQLTLSGGTLRSTNPGSLVLAANRGIQIGAAGGTFEVTTSAGVLRVNGALSGTGAITKVGPGTLMLAGGNGLYSGTVTVNAGALLLAGTAALGNAGASSITVANLAELQVGATANILTYTSYPLTLQGAGPAGAGAFRNIGGSTTWAGPITLAGNTTINTALVSTPLILRGGINLGSSNFQLTLGAQQTTNSPSTFTIGTIGINGTGTVVVDAGFTGSVTIPAASGFIGPTNILSGTVNALNSLALGGGDGTANTGITVAADAVLQLTNDALSENPGPVGIGNKPLTLTGSFLTSLNGALRGQGPGNSYAGPITLTAPTTIAAVAPAGGTGSLTLSGGIAVGNNALTLTTDASSTMTVQTNGITGTAGLTKVGAGTLQLNTASTYSGPTTVSAGRLLVNNQTGSATGTGPVTVASGATMGGIGRIAPVGANNGVTIQGGGVLSPGVGAGATPLTIDVTGGSGVTLAPNAVYEFFVTAPGQAGVAVNSGLSSTGTNTNRLTVQGMLTVDPTTTFRINGNAASFVTPGQYSYLLGTATTLGAPLNITDPARFNTTNFANFTGGTFSVQSVGGSIYLNFAPVPEPAGLLLVCAAGGGVVSVLRRRRVGRSS
jgi:autotransporter-associated beta strand protein